MLRDPHLFPKDVYWISKEPQERPRAGERRQQDTSTGSDPLKSIRNCLRAIYNCPRQNRTVLLDASLYELLYAPYLSKIEGEGIIVMNTCGVYVAKAVGKRVFVDLMDLWSYYFDVFTLDAFDFHAPRRADLVIAWFRAIATLLRSTGLRREELRPRRTNHGANDSLRLSMFCSADILARTASRYPAVYFAERTTMFQCMSSRNAILAEDTPGVRGVISYGEAAYLFPIDRPEKLAEGIIELVRDDGLRKYIGRRARERLEQQYTWQALGKKAK